MAKLANKTNKTHTKAIAQCQYSSSLCLSQVAHQTGAKVPSFLGMKWLGVHAFLTPPPPQTPYPPPTETLIFVTKMKLPGKHILCF